MQMISRICVRVALESVAPQAKRIQHRSNNRSIRARLGGAHIPWSVSRLHSVLPPSARSFRQFGPLSVDLELTPPVGRSLRGFGALSAGAQAPLTGSVHSKSTPLTPNPLRSLQIHSGAATRTPAPARRLQHRAPPGHTPGNLLIRFGSDFGISCLNGGEEKKSAAGEKIPVW